MSVLEAKLSKKRQAEFTQELHILFKQLTEDLNKLNEKYEFANDDNAREVLNMIGTCVIWNRHDYYFHTEYGNSIKVPEEVKAALLAKAVDDLINKMEEGAQ